MACASFALLPVFAPTTTSGQDPRSAEESIYLAAAADFLRSLEPAAVLDEAYCLPSWRDMYGIPLRCPNGSSIRLRNVLEAVADELGISGIAQVPECGPEAEGEVRALRLSPIQFDTARDAWFVVASSCVTAERAREMLYLVRTRLVETLWVLHETTLLWDSGG